MKVLTIYCHLCGCFLQWPAQTGRYTGVARHFETVHPTIPLDLEEYR